MPGANIIRYARREAKHFAAGRRRVYVRGRKREVAKKFSAVAENYLAAIPLAQAFQMGLRQRITFVSMMFAQAPALRLCPLKNASKSALIWSA